MFRFILRRLAILPIALVLINFLGFTYAYVARPIRAASTPYLREQVRNQPPLLESYSQYIQDILHGSLLQPFSQGPQIGSFALSIANSLVASLGLLSIAIVLSMIFGLILGLLAVRNQPPGVRGWLSFISTIGLSMPSFYIGSLSILLIVFVLVFKGPNSESTIPIRGFGWDNHLILPVIALMLRPTVHIAQVTANMLAGEFGKQYIIASRSFGHTWHDIRWRQAMRNVIAPIILSIASSFRLLVGELILVEWLFNWPGLGNLLASTLVPGAISTNLGASSMFLDPTIVAADVTFIGLFFLIADLVASVSVRLFDPRLRVQDETEPAGGLI
jgi:peptide/nickel transport system permease protein